MKTCLICKHPIDSNPYLLVDGVTALVAGFIPTPVKDDPVTNYYCHVECRGILDHAYALRTGKPLDMQGFGEFTVSPQFRDVMRLARVMDRLTSRPVAVPPEISSD